LYRAPSGDVNEFLIRLDATLKYLYNPKSEFIIHGDININYLNENNQKTSKLVTKDIQFFTKEFKIPRMQPLIIFL
jgi:hypothetical protein